ncbi:hypothetical protein BT67DRAFT_268252 [Trichocladium antarcticum]|uniref:Uncharacterized protein n=1 Tax=Trichocladium antarcticum TaxID=1450529 RepID=A0AAN6UM09_9PEZI|nr:hypothetical protein BT67DRAFT_268252 [Trichocladium antarcticum]
MVGLSAVLASGPHSLWRLWCALSDSYIGCKYIWPLHSPSSRFAPRHHHCTCPWLAYQHQDPAVQESDRDHRDGCKILCRQGGEGNGHLSQLEKQVEGFRGNQHKSFHAIDDAKSYLGEDTTTSRPSESISPSDDTRRKPEASHNDRVAADGARKRMRV